MKKLSFDTALKRLEEIVDLLEAGQLSLEESLRMFEEGVKISLYCQEELQKTEGKVSLLMKKMNGGMELVDFEA